MPEIRQAQLPNRRRARWVLSAIGVTIALVIWLEDGARVWPKRRIPKPVVTEARPRRLFATATSEGHSLRRLETGQAYNILLMAPDGKTLYAISSVSQSLTFIGVEDLQVKRMFHLPLPSRLAFLSRNGKHIYISSYEDGVMVVDTIAGRGVERVIQTDAPAFDVAVTPDEKKLFLALGNSGLMRINLQTGERRVLSPVACPVHLNINPSGKRLYVSYQCSGIGGRAGHNTVDIYDVDSEQSVEVINDHGDLAMVSGRLAFAPQEEDVVLLDGLDACHSPNYDHVGCFRVPSGALYLWRASDRRVIATFSFPESGVVSTFFSQGTRLAFSSIDLEIWDWARQMALETLSRSKTGDVALTPTGDRAFATSELTGLLVFDAEKEECLPPIQGLVNFYAADGTRDDSKGSGTLTFVGSPQFVPGLMGQAFRLDGTGSFLLARQGAALCNFCSESWSMSFFVKFRSTAGEMTFLERETTDPVWDLRLFKENDNRIVLKSRSQTSSKFSITSAVRVDAGRWYHIAVVSEKDHRSLYIDGVLQGKQQLSDTIDAPANSVDRRNVFFGATQGKRDFLNGLIDEVAVYDRPLAPGEVMKIAGACGAAK